MKSLYRRYRPVRLTEVIGQEQVTKPLSNSLKNGKISHAYLFVGPRGCGKTSVARILAHEVNDFKYEIEDDYVDIIEIDGASNRGIDNIRELREKVMIAPTSGKYKVYIIDEVHMLTKEAFNALLKTLEEPPKHVIFIMATTDAYKVPVTITSRAQVYTFKLAAADVMMGFLKSVASKEKIKITDEALGVIVKRGGGSFRDTLSLLDQLSTLSADKITAEMVVKAMGLPQDEQIAELLDVYTSGDVVRITTILKELLSSGVKAETLAEELIATIVAKPKSELMSLLAKLPEVKAPFAEAKLLVALTCRQSGIAFSRDGSLRPVVTGEAPSSSVVTSGSPRKGNSRLPSKKPSPAGPSTEKIRSQASKSGDDIGKTGLAASAKQAVTIFDWDAYIDKVKGLNDAVGMQLKKVKHEFDDDTLHIYPEKKIIKSILSRDNNKKILLKAAGNDVKITIHDENDKPSNVKKDAVAERISDIMGGEVQNDRGGNPF
ncbi:DNA polymerase III subunit gamma/tau [Candidatus Saccharibacteria bacterium]|nr:DNA polymerase III subunit gamma/tau [Candidatus Saccharibacteria bacterium]